MPGEEGYPAYLGSRLAQFYERAGRVTALGNDDREGTLSVIGAVSPAGGDISETGYAGYSANCKSILASGFDLAYKRHFAINWLESYLSLYDTLGNWFDKNVADDCFKKDASCAFCRMNLLCWKW